MRFPLLIALVGSALVLTGCASSGSFDALNETQVQLTQANYRIVATNVGGESSAGYLFGLSGSDQGRPSAFALFRVDGEPMLMKRALENLWANFEAEHGPAEGRNLALINVRYDSDAANYLLLYSKLKVSVRADVIEFLPES